MNSSVCYCLMDSYFSYLLCLISWCFNLFVVCKLSTAHYQIVCLFFIRDRIINIMKIWVRCVCLITKLQWKDLWEQQSSWLYTSLHPCLLLNCKFFNQCWSYCTTLSCPAHSTNEIITLYRYLTDKQYNDALHYFSIFQTPHSVCPLSYFFSTWI